MAHRLRTTTIAMVVIALGLVGGAYFAAESPEERAQVRVANRAADRFDRAMDEFSRTSAQDIDSQLKASKTNYQALKTFVDARIDEAPRLSSAGTTDYGRRHSDRYVLAKARRDLVLTPFTTLTTYLREHAIPDQGFVDAGRKLVQINPARILANVAVFTGTPLRELVIPAFEKAKDRLKKQTPPEDSKLLDLDLMTYAGDAIKQTKQGATKIDARQPFVFNFGTRPDDLLRRLVVIESATSAEVRNDVDVLKLNK